MFSLLSYKFALLIAVDLVDHLVQFYRQHLSNGKMVGSLHSAWFRHR
jgi:hypothetical protein